MPDIEVSSSNLLSELDARQDEVMRDLDALDRRIDELTREWTRGFAEISDLA